MRFSKRAKYRNTPTIVDGHRFQSKAEARRYGELKLLERASTLHSLELQPAYPLPGGVVYKGDFRYIERGRVVVEDVKGYSTAEFRVKWRIVQALYPDVVWRLISA